MFFIWNHNFWTRNTSKSIKGSKDSDSSLVSNENLSEILLWSGLIGQARPGSLVDCALGQVTWANWPKPTSLMTSLTKKQNPKLFFTADLEHLPSLLRVWTGLWHNPLRSYVVGLSQPKYPWFFPNFQVQYVCTLAA